MRQSPCRYCPDRALGCHGICPKYIEFRTENEKARTRRHMDQLVTSTLIEGGTKGRADEIREAEERRSGRMERVAGKIALPDSRPEGGAYEKQGVAALSDRTILKAVCVGSYYRGCSSCECFRRCEYGKEAVKRGLRK